MYSIQVQKIQGGANPRLTRTEQLLAAEVTLLLLQRLSDTFLSWVNKIGILYKVATDGSVTFRCELFVLLPSSLTVTRLDYETPLDDSTPIAEVVAKDIIIRGGASLVLLAKSAGPNRNAFRAAVAEISR